MAQYANAFGHHYIRSPPSVCTLWLPPFTKLHYAFHWWNRVEETCASVTQACGANNYTFHLLKDFLLEPQEGKNFNYPTSESGWKGVPNEPNFPSNCPN